MEGCGTVASGTMALRRRFAGANVRCGNVQGAVWGRSATELATANHSGRCLPVPAQAGFSDATWAPPTPGRS